MQNVENESDQIQALTLAIPETVQMLGASTSAAYEAARAGQLPRVRVGTRALVTPRRLEEFVPAAGSPATRGVGSQLQVLFATPTDEPGENSEADEGCHTSPEGNSR